MSKNTQKNIKEIKTTNNVARAFSTLFAPTARAFH